MVTKIIVLLVLAAFITSKLRHIYKVLRFGFGWWLNDAVSKIMDARARFGTDAVEFISLVVILSQFAFQVFCYYCVYQYLCG